jgi:hypothetical protein
VKPKKTTVWACGFCSSIHRDKERAAACCICIEPGCANQSAYTGSRGTRCKPCHMKKCIKEAEEAVIAAQNTLQDLIGRNA